MQEQAESLFGLKLSNDQLLEFQKQFNQYQSVSNTNKHIFKTDYQPNESNLSSSRNLRGSKIKTKANATQAYFTSMIGNHKESAPQIPITMIST